MILSIAQIAQQTAKALELAQKKAQLEAEAGLLVSGISFDVSMDSSDADRKLKTLARENPNYVKAGMRAVNRQVVKDLKKELRQRGYLPHNPQSYGDAGFMGKGNVSFAVNKDFSAKIWFSRNYYHMKFVEYGAQVRWNTRRGNFSLPARPSLNPIARSYWQTGKASQIVEAELQKKYDKLMEGK